MARPDTTLLAIDSQAGDWDATVDQNTDKIELFCFQEPYPMPLVHNSVADSGSSALSGFAAGSYKWCVCLLVDAATPATDGYMIYSDGTNWRYQRTDTIA